jgi:hypothetical protein
VRILPEVVRAAMEASGATVTCLPVRLDADEWETAVFFDVSGAESAADHRILADHERRLALGVEGDLVEHSRAAVVVLRFEAYTLPEDPLAGEVLLTPGASTTHFEALKRLMTQPRIGWFFAGAGYEVLRVQHYPLAAEHHQAFRALLSDAVRHDALVRMTSGYDAAAALADVTARYEPRNEVDPRQRAPTSG